MVGDQRDNENAQVLGNASSSPLDHILLQGKAELYNSGDEAIEHEPHMDIDYVYKTSLKQKKTFW